MYMESVINCQCGNNKYFIHTKKMYEGLVDEKGILICEPEEQHIVEIKCSNCDRLYKTKNFKGVDY